MKKSEILFGALRLPVDYITVILAFLTAYYLRPITDLIPGIHYPFTPDLLPGLADYIKFGLASTLGLIAIFAANDLYSLKVTHRFGKEFFKIVFLVSVWILFIIAYYFLVVHQLFFSRIALAHIWIFSILFISSARLTIIFIQNLLLRFGIGTRRVLFIGANTIADRFYNEIKNDRSYNVIGALDEFVRSRPKGKVKIIDTIERLQEIVRKYNIEEIIQTSQDMKESDTEYLHAFCRNYQIKYHFIPDLVRLQRTNVDVCMKGGMPLVSLKDTTLEGWGHIIKRGFDIVVSLLLIIMLLPLWIIIAIAIKIDSKGPIIYKSNRKYKDKIFGIYKFRSMVKDADKRKKELMDKNERKGPVFKIKDDPRVTRVGRILRKTSIDEFPQLLNVLSGKLSLVGPRPHLPEEIDQYKSHHKKVFALKPGITGLAQVSGRSRLDFEEEIKFDVFYIENWSLLLDLKILLNTIAVIFRANGE